MENITTEQQYGKYFDDREQLTSVIEVTKNGLKRTYKSRSGASAKDRAKRVFVGNSKRKYYRDKDLTPKRLEMLKAYNRDVIVYEDGKAKGLKGLKRPVEPRFSDVKPEYLEPKKPFKDKAQWQNIAKNYDEIVVNNFNCSGNWKFGEFYITLKVKDKRIKSQDVADKQYQAFIKAFKRWISTKKTKDGKQFKYTMLTVKEYGIKGYHYHILLKLQLDSTVIFEWLDKHWKHGDVYIENLTDALKLGKYFFGSNGADRVSGLDVVALDKQLKELESQYLDFIELSKKAKDKGLDDIAKGYKRDSDITKREIKRLRRSKVKSDDTIIRTSGAVKKTIRIVTSDKKLWQFIHETSEYTHSEKIIISDVSEYDGKTYILNEIYSDYYKQNKRDGARLYQMARWLVKTGKAIEK